MSASAALARYLDTIDGILTSGNSARLRYEQFRETHPLRIPAPALPPEHAGLLALYERLYTEHAQTAVPRRSVVRSTGAIAPRALSSRTRI